MRVRLVATALFACLTASSSFAKQEIRIENLDGVISQLERTLSSDSTETNGIKVFLRHEGDLLWMGVDSKSIGVASLCIASKDRISVFHASAALGRIDYTLTGNSWNANEPFLWAMRESSMSDSVVALRTRHLTLHSWVASTAQMGISNQSEFLLQKEQFPKGPIRWAIGVMLQEPPNEVIAAPINASADCGLPNLVKGSPPMNDVRFNTSNWYSMND